MQHALTMDRPDDRCHALLRRTGAARGAVARRSLAHGGIRPLLRRDQLHAEGVRADGDELPAIVHRRTGGRRGRRRCRVQGRGLVHDVHLSFRILWPGARASKRRRLRYRRPPAGRVSGAVQSAGSRYADREFRRLRPHVGRAVWILRLEERRLAGHYRPAQAARERSDDVAGAVSDPAGNDRAVRGRPHVHSRGSHRRDLVGHEEESNLGDAPLEKALEVLRVQG